MTGPKKFLAKTRARRKLDGCHATWLHSPPYFPFCPESFCRIPHTLTSLRAHNSAKRVDLESSRIIIRNPVAQHLALQGVRRASAKPLPRAHSKVNTTNLHKPRVQLKGRGRNGRGLSTEARLIIACQLNHGPKGNKRGLAWHNKIVIIKETSFKVGRLDDEDKYGKGAVIQMWEYHHHHPSTGSRPLLSFSSPFS